MPAAGIKIDRDSDDDENNNTSKKLKDAKTAYMTFAKAGMKNIHYMI